MRALVNLPQENAHFNLADGAARAGTAAPQKIDNSHVRIYSEGRLTPNRSRDNERRLALQCRTHGL